MDTGDQLARAEGFYHIIIGARIEAANTIALFATGGEHDDRSVFEILIPADMLADFDAGHARQHPVEYDNIRAVFLDEIHRLFPVAGGDDAETFFLKVVTQQGDDGDFILDDEYLRFGIRFNSGHSRLLLA